MSVRFLTLLAAMCIISMPVQAHEFWVEPEDFVVDTGDEVTARFRNGQEFVGSTLSYVPARSERFDMIVGGETLSVPVRLGDNPAFAVGDLPEGLLVIVHETSDQTLTYSEWPKFVRFAEHKDFEEVLEAHRARGLPEAGFREAYRRFAKALVAVGGGAGADRIVGLRTEIVAEANPYTDDLSGGLPVQVLLDGAPKAAAQVEMFARDAAGEVEVTLHRADEQGRVTLPVEAGHDYLLDSVAMLPVEQSGENGPVWLSLWAALTFAVPEG